MNAEIAIIAIILIIISSLYIFRYFYLYETMVNIPSVNGDVKWGKDKTCKYQMTSTFMDILKEYNIKESDDDWMIYFPCTYNNINDEIEKVQPKNPNQRIFFVNNSNEIASKSDLWKNLVKTYGRNVARTLAPLTYILYDKRDIDLFDREHNKNMIYILKKNIQRQEGIKITSDKNEIINGYKNEYVVAQELLQDPYTIRGRKTNMRFYVLLVCQNNEISAYVHNEGFMYYTKMPFIKNNSEDGPNITTGYIDRWIYHINPLTHGNFRDYLDSHDRKMSNAENTIVQSGNALSKIIFDRINNLITKVIKSVHHVICQESKLKQYISFQLFGVDIALDDQLNPKVMEFNVGPNLATHDKRDSEIKHMVVRDVMKVLKLVPDTNNGFIKLL